MLGGHLLHRLWGRDLATDTSVRGQILTMVPEKAEPTAQRFAIRTPGEVRSRVHPCHWHQRIWVHNKSSFICRALKRCTCVYVHGSELDQGGF